MFVWSQTVSFAKKKKSKARGFSVVRIAGREEPQEMKGVWTSEIGELGKAL